MTVARSLSWQLITPAPALTQSLDISPWQKTKEKKFDFTTEGEGDISLGEARVLAVRIALESPGDYGSQYPGTVRVF